MNRVDDRGYFRPMRRPATEDARLAAVRVDDIGAKLAEKPGEVFVRPKVVGRADGSEHFIDDDDAVPVRLRAF